MRVPQIPALYSSEAPSCSVAQPEQGTQQLGSPRFYPEQGKMRGHQKSQRHRAEANGETTFPPKKNEG